MIKCMFIIEKMLDIIAPDTCLGCGREGSLTCGECFDTKATASLPCCYKCQKFMAGSITCKDCKKKSPISAVWVCVVYGGHVKDVVHAVKYRPSKSGARRLGVLLARQLPYLDPTQTVVTYAPTTPGRVRERGFDQSKVAAWACAKKAAIPPASLLVRESPFHQVGSSGAARLKHMKNGFSITTGAKFAGKDVIIVDDVMTTGATLESAAKVLKKAGAKRVFGLVFARGT